MGTICILLGLIIFLGFVFIGFIAANALAPLVTSLSGSLVSMSISNTELYVIVVGIFAFIGLLICLNLVMHGLTYNKVCKLARRK